MANLRQGFHLRHGYGGQDGGQVWFLARHEWRVLSASAITRLAIAVFGIALVIAGGIGATRATSERHTVATFAQRGGISAGGPRASVVAKGSVVRG